MLAGVCVGAVAAMTIAAGEAQPPVPVAATGPLQTVVATTASSSPAPSPGVTPSLPAPADLARLVPDSKLSVMVHDRKNDIDVVSYRPEATYTSASLVKLLIAMESLSRGGSAEVVVEMLSRSDDTTASTLWTQLGGQAIVTRWAKTAGMTSTRPPADPRHWGSTIVTAADMVRFYEYLADQAPGPIRQVVMRGLSSATKFGADGFDQYFGIPDVSTGWAVKQGWSCCDPGRNLHTSGFVDADRYIVVVLTAQPASTGWATASDQVTSVLKTLAGPLGWPA